MSTDVKKHPSGGAPPIQRELDAEELDQTKVIPAFDELLNDIDGKLRVGGVADANNAASEKGKEEAAADECLEDNE